MVKYTPIQVVQKLVDIISKMNWEKDYLKILLKKSLMMLSHQKTSFQIFMKFLQATQNHLVIK